MRKYALPVMLALTGTLALGACSQQDQSAQTQPAAAQQAPTASSEDCAQLVAHLAAMQPAVSSTAGIVAPTLKAGQAGVASTSAAPAEPAPVQLSAEDETLQTACYSYLSGLVQNNLKGMRSNQPYAYLVPAGNTMDNASQRGRQLDQVTDVVMRGVMPGNLLAFAGPDSTQTANLMVSAFGQAQPSSLKGVIVVFVGSPADQARVEKVVKPTAATFRFVAM